MNIEFSFGYLLPYYKNLLPCGTIHTTMNFC